MKAFQANLPLLMQSTTLRINTSGNIRDPVRKNVRFLVSALVEVPSVLNYRTEFNDSRKQAGLPQHRELFFEN